MEGPRLEIQGRSPPLARSLVGCAFVPGALALGGALGAALASPPVPWLGLAGGDWALPGAAAGCALGFLAAYHRFQTQLHAGVRVELSPDALRYFLSSSEPTPYATLPWSAVRSYRIDARGWVHPRTELQELSGLLDLRIPCGDEAETAAVAGWCDERGIPRR